MMSGSVIGVVSHRWASCEELCCSAGELATALERLKLSDSRDLEIG